MLTASVAIGTYNGAAFLAEQLASILRQDRLPDEIVLSDDGSTDTTLDVARQALEGAERAGVRILLSVTPTNLGVTGNFAAAIGQCTSEVVVLSDQDDIWHPSRLYEVMDAFEADPSLDLRHEDARLVDADGVPLGRTLFESLSVAPSELTGIESGGAFAVYLRRNLATGATMSFRRRLIDRASPFPPEWVHDEWLAIIAAATGRVSVSRRASVDYRQHGSNQIGVVTPTLRYRLSRMLDTAPERNDVLARRARVLADRLVSMTGVEQETADAAEAKARFEAARAALPPGRLERAVAIVRIERRGYGRFASQGRLDMLRDVLQRRGDRR